jgi:lipopolysaccharide transport system ATP-binding protein
MTDVAIRVENLGKQYRIGGPQARYKTFRESLTQSVQAPFRRLASVVRGQPASASGETIWALKDVSFEVKRGEVVGIIGRNGAGKSTLLKILSRITEPTEGEAELHGRVGSLLEVGTGFHPELTGRENVYLNGAILGMRRAEIERKFDEIIAFAEIAKFLDTPVKRYSSGMYVRLAFAVAAHLEPEILLVDEVLAVGDAEFQKKCLGKMGDVAREGRTVLFVSHNMAAILNLCESIVLLEDGCISMSGEPSKVVSHYLMVGAGSDGEVAIAPDAGGITDDFRFRSVRILDPSSSLMGQIPLIGGGDVEIEYEVIHHLQGANVAFHLWSAEGICVLSSTDADHESSIRSGMRVPGQYTARCHIPQSYLRPGRYFLGVSASIPRVRVLADLPRVLAFDVVDTGSVESRTLQGRQGVIAPVLEWTTRQVSKYETSQK